MKQAVLYIVIRLPCFVGDRGRHSLACAFKTREVAERWIASQEKEFCKPSDYYIEEVTCNE